MLEVWDGARKLDVRRISQSHTQSKLKEYYRRPFRCLQHELLWLFILPEGQVIVSRNDTGHVIMWTTLGIKPLWLNLSGEWKRFPYDDISRSDWSGVLYSLSPSFLCLWDRHFNLNPLEVDSNLLPWAIIRYHSFSVQKKREGFSMKPCLSASFLICNIHLPCLWLWHADKLNN